MDQHGWTMSKKTFCTSAAAILQLSYNFRDLLDFSAPLLRSFGSFRTSAEIILVSLLASLFVQQNYTLVLEQFTTIPHNLLPSGTVLSVRYRETVAARCLASVRRCVFPPRFEIARQHNTIELCCYFSIPQFSLSFTSISSLP